MPNYVVIENEIITEEHDIIPRNWRNISGFDLMTDNERATFGFYPVKKSDVQFDGTRQRIITYEILLDSNGLPYENLVVEDFFDSEAYKRQQFTISIELLRTRRDRMLEVTDWAILPDVVAAKGAEWQTAWTNYRQQLRDITTSYLANKQPFDVNAVEWPIKPY